MTDERENDPTLGEDGEPYVHSTIPEGPETPDGDGN